MIKNYLYKKHHIKVVKPLGRGFGCNHSFLILYKNRRSILKIEKREKFARERILNQIRVLKKIEKYKFSPQIIEWGEHNGKIWFLTEYFKNSRRIQNKDISQFEFDLRKFLNQLHSIKIRGFGYINPESGNGIYETWPDYLKARLNQNIGILTKIFTKTKLSLIKKIFNKNFKKKELSTGYLVHGDLHRNNILIDRKGRLKIIDWEDILSGDPLIDFAFAANYFNDRNVYLKLFGRTNENEIWFYRIFLLLQDIAFRYQRNIAYLNNMRILMSLLKSRKTKL